MHAPAAKNTPHQIHTKCLILRLIKHQNIAQNTKIRAVFWSVWTVYIRVVGTGQQAFNIVEINRRAPKPLHWNSALLLGHIRYVSEISPIHHDHL